MKTINVFAHEIKVGETFTYNKIYPRTITVETKKTENGDNTIILNCVKYAKYKSIKRVIN